MEFLLSFPLSSFSALVFDILLIYLPLDSIVSKLPWLEIATLNTFGVFFYMQYFWIFIGKLFSLLVGPLFC